MRNLRRRVHLLERLPQYQLPSNPLEPATSLALPQISDGDLELLMGVYCKGAGG
jgi:hypothetical protein